jgi:hypothetical protein
LILGNVTQKKQADFAPSARISGDGRLGGGARDFDRAHVTEIQTGRAQPHSKTLRDTLMRLETPPGLGVRLCSAALDRAAEKQKIIYDCREL